MLLDAANRREETALAARVASGDEQAFSTVFHRYQGQVYRYLRQMSGSSSTAEDVTQEVFIALMETSDRFDASKGSLKVYLYGIARNLLRRHVRRQSMQREVDLDHVTEVALPVAGEGSDALADLERAEAIALLRRAIVALPPHYREVIVLCELHELSYEEAALIVDCPLGTIRSRLNRARRVLARKCRLDAGASAQEASSLPPRRCLA
jgi:RNA polymerase sigma-70 factor (ECF subfamily)